MFEWWESLGEIGRVFACVAIPSTVILFLQTILMLIGIGGSDADADGGSVEIDSDVEIESADGIFGGEDVSTDSEFELDDGL